VYTHENTTSKRNILALQTGYDDSVRISDDDDYDSGEEWREVALATEPNLPNGFLVELKATKENNNVILSAVNITTKPSIYDFQGECCNLWLLHIRARGCESELCLFTLHSEWGLAVTGHACMHSNRNVNI
jgi:hypothetical protein